MLSGKGATENTPSTLIISDRSRRESPIAIELRAVAGDELSIDHKKLSSFDIFNEFGDEVSDVFNTFEPRLMHKIIMDNVTFFCLD